MRLTRYEAYHKVNIDWLNEIPVHWSIKRNKEVFVESTDTNTTGEELLLTVSHITGVTLRSEKNVNMFFAETMIGYKRCKEGDLIINTMWAWMGALGVSKHNGICSPAYSVYSKRGTNEYSPEYFGFLYSTPNFIKEMTRYSKGIVQSRLRLYSKDFYRINICFPKYEEQVIIVNFLNSKSKAIDKKIALLEKKIKKYKILRKSIINKILSKGLTPGVRLKNSGLELNRQIPYNWKVKRVKDVLILHTGNSISDKAQFKNPKNSVPYIATKDIAFSSGNINFNNGVFIPNNAFGFKTAKPFSTLICLEGASAGKKIGFTDRRVCFVNKLCCIKSKNKEIYDKYFYYFANSDQFRNQFFSLINGLIGGVSLSLVKQFEIPIPSIEEQKEISNYLDSKTDIINTIITNMENQIEYLTELRKTLINDVTTGKLKVTE